MMNLIKKTTLDTATFSIQDEIVRLIEDEFDFLKLDVGINNE